MSLKWFHLVFISLSVVLSVVFGFWAVFNAHAFVGAGSFCAAGGLGVYGHFFLQKARRIGLA